jgi:hypothetical protein
MLHACASMCFSAVGQPTDWLSTGWMACHVNVFVGCILVGGLGCAIAQAVSRRLPTAAATVRSRVRSCGIYGERSGTGAGYLRVLRFPLPILIPPNAPYSPIIRGW